jgi:SAM-dependent methyltransferase
VAARTRGSAERRKQKRADRSRGRRRAAGARAAADLALAESLDLLAARRAPYAALLAAIIADTLARFPPPDAGPLVEIGAGTGQLRGWLPAALRARTLHTDPSARALAALRAGDANAPAAVARAEQLPLAAGRAAGVAGLCVMDAVADAEAAAAEIARVLPPGGRFWHFLDMATLLEVPFAKLHASNLVPIPNVLGDPADHEWPLDILLLDRAWLAGLLDFARATAGSLAAFAPTFAPFLAGAERFDAEAATKAFQAVASSGDRRHDLMSAFVAASRLAIERGYPARKPLPFHSGKYLKSVLDTAFDGAFEIEESGIVVRAASRPATDDIRYRSLCLGHERVMTAPPARRLAAVPAAAPAELLLEAGVFAFVARRRDG